MASEQNGFSLLGHNLFGDPILPPSRGIIADKFTIPPFSVLNARDGAWQDRKRAWIATGIQSEVGRGLNTLGLSAEAEAYRNGEGAYAKANHAANSNAAKVGGGMCDRLAPRAAKLGCRPHAGGAADERPGRDASEDYEGGDAWLATNNSGTSIFDPVLTELCYRWFCPKGGMILDPFAGGYVRGIVAGLLGFRYHGIDLRPEQIAANEQQRSVIAPDADIAWVCGDSREQLASAPDADFVFTCPPYGDLEKYSDHPDDLSAMSYAGFCAAYRDILQKAIARLNPDRFMAVVVGEFRDPKTGLYRGFVPFTQAVCVAAGADFYNEAILVTAVGSLPIRITKQFEAGRKMGKTHQNVLVFVKGNPRAAADACEGQLELAL